MIEIPGLSLINSYNTLPEEFFSDVKAEKVKQPQLLLWNNKLAESLGINTSGIKGDQLAAIFSGQKSLTNSKPIAQAYAGHQFGYFNMLGDGRAILLGEQQLGNGGLKDIQLKGPGRTPYSRRGDGKATLYSMLREYLISEAMHTLNIPTSRSLAVVETGEEVIREEINRGAILTRIASSHIRVGTFEFANRFVAKDKFQVFCNYVIQRHYPELVDAENPTLELLKAVQSNQIKTIVHWIRVGFIHGVMNTDNTSISGETFDYGPCAFMNTYNPATVFSSIDTNGRYAFGNQPKILLWNIARFAESLLPLLHSDKKKAIDLAQGVIDAFGEEYEKSKLSMYRKKLGMKGEETMDDILVTDFLDILLNQEADYTNSFLSLTYDEDFEGAPKQTEAYKEWLIRYKKRTKEKDVATMQAYNPVVIPRNHVVENALTSASEENDLSLFNELHHALSNPYQLSDKQRPFIQLSPIHDNSYRTFCGT